MILHDMVRKQIERSNKRHFWNFGRNTLLDERPKTEKG
jgi:hypothetical protein